MPRDRYHICMRQLYMPILLVIPRAATTSSRKGHHTGYALPVKPVTPTSALTRRPCIKREIICGQSKCQKREKKPHQFKNKNKERKRPAAVTNTNHRPTSPPRLVLESSCGCVQVAGTNWEHLQVKVEIIVTLDGHNASATKHDIAVEAPWLGNRAARTTFTHNGGRR